eukprot:m.99376 g.99376  ORF g.99376 m.99376 type:complete len:96 (+) comp15097_c0_seq2:2074-2361(+)
MTSRPWPHLTLAQVMPLAYPRLCAMREQTDPLANALGKIIKKGARQPCQSLGLRLRGLALISTVLLFSLSLRKKPARKDATKVQSIFDGHDGSEA